jgi:hypothetical protein
MNSNLFKLSKHFGMITLYDFYKFPEYSADYPLYSPVHILAGLENSSSSRGARNLSFKDVFAFLPGDIFYTINSGTDPHFYPPTTRTVSIILDSVWNKAKDTVTYI